jgi:signal peptidase I
MAAKRGRIRPLFLISGAVAGVAAALLARRWVDAVEVAGLSMAPALLPGDLLLVERASLARRPPRAGELVLATDPREPSRELVKRVATIEGGQVTLRGDAIATTDSLAFGPVPAAEIRWRVLGRYWPPQRAGRIEAR